MAENNTAGAQPGTGAAAPGAQPPGASSPNPTPGASGSPPADAFEEAFAEAPSTAAPAGPKPGASAAAPSSSPDRAAAAAGGIPGADGQQPPTPDVLPFDDELAALVPAAAGTGAADLSLLDLNSPEAIQKAINPDGKVSETDQLKNLQTLVGKHAGEVHVARQLAAQLEPLIVRDQAGKIVGIDHVKVISAAPKEVIDQLLAAGGYKIVPANFGEVQAGLAAEYPVDLVEKFLPSTDAKFKEMSFEEKVEFIRADPDRLVDFKLERRERERQTAGLKRQGAQRAAQEADTRLRELATSDKTFDALSKRSGADKLDSYLDRANAEIPAEVSGRVRVELAYKIAKLYRLMDPAVRRGIRDTLYKAAENDLLNKRKLGAPVGGGGVDVGKTAGAGAGAKASDKGVWGDE